MLNSEWGKNLVVFVVHNRSFAHAEDREKDILVLLEGSSDRLDDATITAGVTYSINMTKSRKKKLFKFALQWK